MAHEAVHNAQAGISGGGRLRRHPVGLKWCCAAQRGRGEDGERDNSLTTRKGLESNPANSTREQGLKTIKARRAMAWLSPI